MKNKQSTFLIILFLFQITLSSIQAQVSIHNLNNRVSTIVNKLEIEMNAQVLQIKINILKKDDIGLEEYQLSAGSDYVIVAVGDRDRIQDIDLAVLDAKNVLEGKDNDDADIATVRIRPLQTQLYKFRAKGYRMSKNDGFYALIICRLGNETSIDIDLGKYVSKVTSLKKVALYFLKNNDTVKARTALEMAKEEEYLEYLGRSNRYQNRRISFNFKSNYQNIKFQGCETDYNKVKNDLTDLVVELNKLKQKSRNPEEDQKFNAIISKLNCLGEVYHQRLKEIFSKTEGFEDEVAKYHQIPKLRGFMSLLNDLSAPDGQTVVIYTLSMRDEYWMILVTPDIIETKSVSLKSADISKKINLFRNAVQNRNLDPKPLAKELYKDLFKPFAETLDKLKTKTIVWSLDRELRYLPVAALHDGTGYLVEKYSQVIYTPASAFHLAEGVPTNLNSLGFGVYNSNPPLPYVKNELEGLFNNGMNGILKGNFFFNEQFTLQKLKDEVNKPNGYLSLHIASHFILKPGQNSKKESFLLLGNSEKLTVETIDNSLNLFLGVHLLTLSACDTAYTSNESNGTEIESFAVLAQEQGAKSVMATLWQVNDFGTSEFMKTFYTKWLSYPIQTKANALQQAQLQIMNGNYKNLESNRNRGIELAGKNADKTTLPVFKTDKNAPFAHPYYWSPYVLIGNWK